MPSYSIGTLDIDGSKVGTFSEETMKRAYDQAGRAVAVLLNSHLQKGPYSIPFDGKKLAAGVYILKLSLNEKIVSKRLVAQ